VSVAQFLDVVVGMIGLGYAGVASAFDLGSMVRTGQAASLDALLSLSIAIAATVIVSTAARWIQRLA